MTKKTPLLTEQLRQAILDCGETQSDVCRATGIDKSALSRFMSGERGVSMENLNILGQYLGLDLVPRRQPKRR